MDGQTQLKSALTGRYRIDREIGQGGMAGKITADTKFDSTDFRNSVPRLSQDNRKANQKLVHLLARWPSRNCPSKLKVPASRTS